MMDSPGPLDPRDPNIPSKQSPTKAKPAEKPLPPAPIASSQIGVEEIMTNSPVTKNEDGPDERRPSLSTTRLASFQKHKIKVTGRNRYYMVVLPQEDEIGRSTTRLDYLTRQDVLQRLSAWEAKGFSTKGFELEPPLGDAPSNGHLEGQSRPIHPNPDEEVGGREKSKPHVQIPDLRQWNDYIAQLRDEKLRSLGVTSSDDEPVTRRSPAPSLMSRQDSSQSSTLFTSPPLRASSIMSNPMQKGANPNTAPGVSHFPRYSLAMPFGEKGGVFPGHVPPNQPPLQRNISPLAYLSSHSGSRIASPSLNEQLANLNEAVNSNANATLRNDPFVDSNDRQLPQQSLTASFPARTTSRSDPVDAVALPPHQRVLQGQNRAEIVTPVPQGHRQNPSESLQREVEEAEAALEREEAQSKAEERRDKMQEPINSSTGARRPTSPILEDDVHKQLDDGVAASNGDTIQKPTHKKHGSRPSMSSRLNVNAPEFKFQPTSFTSETFAFMPNQTNVRSAFGGPAPLFSAATAHNRKTSMARPLPKLNAAAPVFTPGVSTGAKANAPPRVFSFGLTSASEFGGSQQHGEPSREFSFSSMFSTKAPSLNPDAPSFTPGDGTNSAPPSEAGDTRRIFSNVSFNSDVIKPPKKSKALPITKPLEGDDDGDGPEDESGRIGQPDDRQKRMRRNDADGDEVPRFATPTHAEEPTGLGDPSRRSSNDGQGEPTTAAAANGLLRDYIEDLSASEVSSFVHKAPSPRRHELLKRADLDPEPVETHSELDSVSSASGHDTMSEVSDRSAENVATEAFRIGEDVMRVMDTVRDTEPTFSELDDVMQTLNQVGDNEIGIERGPTPSGRPNDYYRARSPREVLQETVARQLLPPEAPRGSRPPASPNRLRESFQYLPESNSESVDSNVAKLVQANARHSPSYRPLKNSPPIHHLNSAGHAAASDWEEDFCSDEGQIRSRAPFFDQKVNDVVGQIVDHRLGPLETTLTSIQHSLEHLSKRASSRTASRRPRSSGTMAIEQSDADDEDDTGTLPQIRPRSPVKDHKFEQLRHSVAEIANAQKQLTPASQMAELMRLMGDLKSVVAVQSQGNNAKEPDANAADAEGGKSARGRSQVVNSTSQAAAIEKSQLQISGLESMLKVSEARAEDELKARRATEDALADNQRLLRQALQEATQQRESSEAMEAKLQENQSERHEHLKQIASLEGAQENLEETTTDLAEKNKALEGTLAEYRLSYDQWKRDIEHVRHENKELHVQFGTRKAEADKLREEKDNLRSKVNFLQESIASASQSLAADRTRWKSKQEEQGQRLDLLGARLEAEARTRERLETEIERLEAQEKEALRSRFQIEQFQKANHHLDKLIGQLRSESHEHQNSGARLQRELTAARETHIMENHRLRSIMDAEAKKSHREMERVRSESQDAVARNQRQLSEVLSDLENLKAAHRQALEQASKSSSSNLQTASSTHEQALEESRLRHEQGMNGLKAQLERDLSNAAQDKQRYESYYIDRLKLADERSVHLEDKVHHLEEKLEIAKSAAQAAAQAAATKISGSAPGGASTTTSPVQASLAKVGQVPEKISPQALRESILVLQEQLQAREARIEELESKLGAVDTNAPAKLKDADMEITWLRELLGVRLDDLREIINVLSQPTYDRDAVRDAAIRLRANLQMEQQEKERYMKGGQTLPNLSNLRDLASSPQALPMAAAAAWGSWRRGRDVRFDSLNATASGSEHDTPSKASTSPQSFFAGLMTPPSTNLRTTPPLPSPRQRPTRPSPARPRITKGLSIQPQSVSLEDGEDPLASIEKSGPTTPTLTQESSYDLDAAEASVFGGLQDDHSEEDSKGKQLRAPAANDDEPFGPSIATFASPTMT